MTGVEGAMGRGRSVLLLMTFLNHQLRMTLSCRGHTEFDDNCQRLGLWFGLRDELDSSI